MMVKAIANTLCYKYPGNQFLNIEYFLMNKSILLLALLVMLFSGKQNKHTGKNKEKTYPVGQIKTEMGEVLFWLYDETPKHKASFIKLANDGYWDSFTFNRVIKNS
jgi:peptidyl-prolyl cis-trans isomerase B (cyclophilin B)